MSPYVLQPLLMPHIPGPVRRSNTRLFIGICDGMGVKQRWRWR